jgi:hypothetical protein
MRDRRGAAHRGSGRYTELLTVRGRVSHPDAVPLMPKAANTAKPAARKDPDRAEAAVRNQSGDGSCALSTTTSLNGPLPRTTRSPH